MTGNPFTLAQTLGYLQEKAVAVIVKNHLDEHMSVRAIQAETGISNGLISKWVKLYLTGGIEALENKPRPGNPLAKFMRKQTLSPMEELQLENLELKIELEQLKKGYKVKGAGANKEYVFVNNKN